MANQIITDEMVLTLAKWASPDAFVFGQEALSKQPAALARSRKILEKLAPMILEEAAKVPSEAASICLTALRHEGYEEGMRDGQAEATGAQADFWTMALRYFKEHGEDPASDDGEGHNAYQMMDALFEHVRNIRAEKDARIAELEATLAKAKETADAEFTAKLRYRDERMAAEAEVKRLREGLAGVLPPSHGLYGGPLVQMVARYEDSTDETSARHKGTISHEAVARARATLGREG